MKALNRQLQWVALFATTALLISCSDVRLQKPPPGKLSVASAGNFCTKNPDDIKRYTKFLFVMDKSGSNGTTDPGGTKRAGSLELFYNENKDKEYIRWGLITFQQPGTKAQIGQPEKPAFVPGSDPQVLTAINSLRNGDSGNTPYGDALSLTLTAIDDDIKAYPDEDNLYMVMFISDGQPTGAPSDEAGLRSVVKNIVNLSPGRVFLSTGYYNASGSDNTAISRLRAMAEEGMGKFVNFQNTNVFDFNDLLVSGPTKEPWQVKNFVVYNLNASICENGAYEVDSDGDGVCDKDEVKYGLNPQKRFSRAGGYGDYFVWRSIKFGESMAPCDDRSDEDFDHLTACEEAQIFNQTPISPSPDITIPQRGNPLNPDTDLDGFLDGLEIFSFRDKSSPMNSRDVLTSFDSEADAGTQIKQHKNPLKWDPEAYAYNSMVLPQEIRTETGQTCYAFSQTKLLIYPTLEVSAEDNFPSMAHPAGGNKVMVYFIQTPQRAPLDRGILMYDTQTIQVKSQAISDAYGTGVGLKVNEAIFKSYRVPTN